MKEELNKKEKYIIGLAVLEVGGPYHKMTRFYNHLLDFHLREYNEINDQLDRESGINTENIPLILDALYLLNEVDEGDFEAVCRNDIRDSIMGQITRADIKCLCDKLESLYKCNS